MQKKKVKPYRLNKSAFDAVFRRYRQASLSSAVRSGGMRPSGGKGASPKNPSDKYTVNDYKADVEKVVKSIIPVKFYRKFLVIYGEPWTPEDTQGNIELSQLAFAVFGGVCHSFEQRLGAAFISNGIYRRKREHTEGGV